MGVAVVVFLFVSCFIFGGYLVYAKLPGYLANKQLEKRLQELGGRKQADGNQVLLAEITADIRSLARIAQAHEQRISGLEDTH